MAEEKKLEQEYLPEEITEKDVKKSWLTYYFFAETGISYERLQALGFCMSLIPIFKKLYKKKEDFTAALKRHMVFYNTEAVFGSVINGITIAMEEQKAKGAPIDDETITSVKSGLMGPMAGVLVELVKILLNFVMTGTSTAGVGEIANFIIGCSFCVPAGLIYRKNRTRKSALIGMATGTLLMIVIGCFVNGFVLLPTYAKAFGMPIDALVGMGTAVNSHITSLSTFVMFAVAPFNLVKGIVVSLVVFLIYKKISPIFRIR